MAVCKFNFGIHVTCSTSSTFCPLQSKKLSLIHSSIALSLLVHQVYTTLHLYQLFCLCEVVEPPFQISYAKRATCRSHSKVFCQKTSKWFLPNMMLETVWYIRSRRSHSQTQFELESFGYQLTVLPHTLHTHTQLKWGTCTPVNQLLMYMHTRHATRSTHTHTHTHTHRNQQQYGFFLASSLYVAVWNETESGEDRIQKHENRYIHLNWLYRKTYSTWTECI